MMPSFLINLVVAAVLIWIVVPMGSHYKFLEICIAKCLIANVAAIYSRVDFWFLISIQSRKVSLRWF